MDSLKQLQVKYLETKEIINKVSSGDNKLRGKYSIEYIELMGEFIKFCEDYGVNKTIRKVD